MRAPKPSRVLTKPTPGYYLVSLVPGAWLVPARIIERDGKTTGEVNGEALKVEWTEEELEASAALSIVRGTLFEHPLLRISLFGKMTDEPTYLHRMAMKTWAETYAPTHPAANPMKPMDPRLLPAEDF